MGQVPAVGVQHYVVLGDGRLARHLAFYFSHFTFISFSVWSRTQERESRCEPLDAQLKRASHVIYAVSDRAIEELFNRVKAKAPSHAIHIHCSGALSIEGMVCAHPMMTFARDLYELEAYQRMLFVIDETGPAFRELFPELPNAHFRIKPALRARYHALCAASGNLVSLIWKESFAEFDRLGISASAVRAYLGQVAVNSLADPVHAPTGALVRKDRETVRKHLKELDGSTLKEVYSVFANRMLAETSGVESAHSEGENHHEIRA